MNLVAARPSLARHVARSLIVCLLFALVAVPALPVQAAGNIVVQALQDTDDAGQHPCTLREALQAIANAQNSPFPSTYHECSGAAQGVNSITFSVSGTITVNDTLPFITSIVNMTGPIILKGKPALNGPIIRLGNSSAVFNVAGVTFTKGSPAILVVNGGVLNIAGSSFVDNVNSNDGGAISSDGKVNIAGTNFTANRAEGSYGGGAIIMFGAASSLAIGGSVFNGNTAKRSGGAIYAAGAGNIADTIFNGNIAEGLDPNNNGNEGDPADDYSSVGAGALYNANDGSNGRKMVITRSVFNGNIAAPKGNGGAIFNQINSVVEIQDSSFNGNLAGSTSFDRVGGAIANLGAHMSITRSTLMNNAVTGDGGGIANLRGNVQSLSNVLVLANAATSEGGGIYNVNTQMGSDIRPQLSLLNVTVSSNAALSGGGIFGQAPSSSYPEVTILGNTIIAGSDAAGGNCAGGPFTSRGHNLDSGTSCGLAGTGDLASANPALEAPSFNGGPLAELLSQKLLPGSQAIDTGDPAICAAAPVANVDQRGEPRTSDGDGDGITGCDIGSYEGGTVKAGFGSTPVKPGPILFGNVTLGTSGNATFTIFSTGNKNLEVSNPQLSGPNAAEFAIVSGLPLDTATSAQVVLSCTPAGTTAGVRTAGLTLNTNDPGNPTVTFDLLCNAVPAPVPGFGSNPAAPGPVSFGEVIVGQTKNGALTVFETGDAPLAVNTLVLGGANPGDFSFGGGVDLNLPNGEPPFDISLSCTPTAPGIRTATLTMNTSDPGKPQVVFNLSCIGITPPPLVLDAGSSTNVAGGLPALNAPYGVAISPDGWHVYVAGQASDAVYTYARDQVTGQLGIGPIQTLTDPDTATDGDPLMLNGAIRVFVSPDGKNVYVTSAAGIVAYARDSGTGFLTKLDKAADNDPYPCEIVGPCVVSRLASPYGVAFSPDGKFIYVSSIADSAVVVFRRDTDGGLVDAGGDLLYVGSTINADLNAAYDVVLSPDGAYLYVAGFVSDTILVYKRNAVDGTLGANPVDVERATTIPALDGVFRLAVSPDGNHVYAASYTPGNSVVAFGRNGADGTLTHLASYTDGGTDALGQTIDGLATGTAVTVSSNGAIVYATGYTDAAVAAFARNPASGLLTFIQAVKRNPPAPGGLPPLGGARDVVVSPDGRTVHASGLTDDRIVTLASPNPTPALTSLAPASVTQGNPAFTLTVNGENFVNGALVRWNGADLVTEFISAAELRATVTADLVSAAGSASVTVFNPAPGGGLSVNALPFTISPPGDNPVPSIEALNPQGAAAGGPGFTMTVVGANFLPGTKVYWNGVERPTTYISGGALQVQIPAADIAQPGDSAVSVVSPGPGGGSSNALAFSVAAPGENPKPSIAQISPASVVLGTFTGSELAITIIGSNFMPESNGQWNGEDRPTTYISPTELRMVVTGSDISVPGGNSIRVVNPAPGGGESNTVAFDVGDFGDNPLPSLSRAVASFNSDGTVTITITGDGFIAASQAQWNGANRTTTMLSPSQLTLVISSADYAAGSAIITVANPGPGGGTSNELLYQLIRLGLPVVMR